MTQLSANANAYLRTKVLTASPEELRLMLLDGAIKFLRQGCDGIDRKDWEVVFDGFSKCRNILVELMSSVRAEIEPDLCARVTSLYTFMYTQLVEAGFEKDVDKGRKVLELLEYERETWVLAVERAAAERASGHGQPVKAPAARAPALSIQG